MVSEIRGGTAKNARGPVTLRSAFSVEGSGPPLFLIHGIGASRHSWDGLVARLKAHFRCMSYDLRGHGKSPMPRAPLYARRSGRRILEDLREELAIERAHFAGHSLGGMIGPAYARRYPHGCRPWACTALPRSVPTDDSAKVRGVVAAMRAQGIAPVLETLKERWFTPEFAARCPAGDRAAHAAGDRYRQGGVPQRFRHLRGDGNGPWLAEIATLSGAHRRERRRLQSAAEPQIAAALPDSELVILPACAMPFCSRPRIWWRAPYYHSSNRMKVVTFNVNGITSITRPCGSNCPTAQWRGPARARPSARD